MKTPGKFELAFASQCQRWAKEQGADEAGCKTAYKAGFALSGASAQGHACLFLEEHMLQKEALIATKIVGEEGSGKPLIVDESGYLYLSRYFETELSLSAALFRRFSELPLTPGENAQKMLNALFPNKKGVLDPQKLAVALALCRRFVVIGGGPGTGKTSTVARFLACLLADDPQHRIMLAAPTGKAAARIQESLASQLEKLPPDIAAKIPAKAFTLHRLLGIGAKPGQNRPRYHAGNRLSVDTLIVDEASMLDMDLTLKLCQALPDTARLILLGDPHQLQSVETGAVFAPLSESAALTPKMRQQLAALTGFPGEWLETAPYNGDSEILRDSAVRLTQSYRFDEKSPLGGLARALIAGEGASALSFFKPGARVGQSEGLIQIAPEDGNALSLAEFEALKKGYAPYIAALQKLREGHSFGHAGSDPDPAALFALFAALGEFCVLCATRQGGRGVQEINKRLVKVFFNNGKESLIGEKGFATARRRIFHGQAIMILENHPLARLFNGDIGIALEDTTGLSVYFPDGENGFRPVMPARLPTWESAFAITVHKSQGSEFQRVALVLPKEDSPLLTRELIYTAITRAKQGVWLLGQGSLLEMAALRKTTQKSGLSRQFLKLAAKEESMSGAK